ncbi:biotin carboxyl carrier protein of acetyl-CoA carboxylase, chloroplastic-like [Lycium barbarum]|uniref:biotin carboxyl carrier protein of acetyl-CoA carboxylase, chloroplastic-like n=1 Tax=Lycium barbarum TaxID=112863 RepID=UPI00293EB6B1|nr:biotin carboxyl carrier protein of acetyl-CoA carboxylase, chloroplastic-like [Lycium barbarum]
MTTSFQTTPTATSTPALFPSKNAPKSLTLLPFCHHHHHHRHYNHLHNKVSSRFSITPKFQFSCKGLHSSWNHSAVGRAQLNEVAVGGSSNDAATPSEEVKSPSETSYATSVSEETISNFISQVSSLVKLVDSRDVVELRLKQLDCEILIRKKEALPQPPSPAPAQIPVSQSYHVSSVQPSAPPAPAAAPPPIQTPAPPPAAAKSADSSLPPLKSPMAGTFYRSPAPGEPAFVKVGDKVQKGQVLCIIEAMKLMNEIEADRSGTIVEVVAEDAKPVSVDTPLFVIKP